MRKHRLDPFSLLFGFWFTVFGALSLGGDPSVDALPRPGWLVPLGLVVVGALMVGSAVRRSSVHEPDETAVAREDEELADRGADE